MNNFNTRISELKGYGILLVVMGHAFVSSEQGYSIRNFIYLFHLAIFYYASGYLFKDEPTLKSKIIDFSDCTTTDFRAAMAMEFYSIKCQFLIRT